MLDGCGEKRKLLLDFTCLSRKIAQDPHDKNLLNKLGQVSDLMDAAGEWDLEQQCQEILRRLGIKDLDKKATEILSKFRYQKNTVFLHSDPSMMPRNRKTWSSWNYLSNKNEKSSTTYWMNQLQDLGTSLNVFVSLNPFEMPNKSLIHKKIVYVLL